MYYNVMLLNIAYGLDITYFSQQQCENPIIPLLR